MLRTATLLLGLLCASGAYAYETPLGPQPDFTAPGHAVYPAGTTANAIADDYLVKASVLGTTAADHTCYMIRTDTGECTVEYDKNGGGAGDGQ